MSHSTYLEYSRIVFFSSLSISDPKRGKLPEVAEEVAFFFFRHGKAQGRTLGRRGCTVIFRRQILMLTVLSFSSFRFLSEDPSYYFRVVCCYCNAGTVALHCVSRGTHTALHYCVPQKGSRSSRIFSVWYRWLAAAYCGFSKHKLHGRTIS